MRHPTTRTWTFPPERPAPPPGLERTNLRELAARPDRFEHHLVVVARIGTVQLELATASEPLYFAHENISDEYAVALPTGDALLDGFPLRTFVSDAAGTDVARYNHKSGDLVLHPLGAAHWPGRLRPPYEGLAIPPGMRRCGLSLVYCANAPTPSNARPVALAERRAGDVKAYGPAPTLALADLRAVTGVVASIGTTTLELVERPSAIAPPHGGWCVVLDVAAGPHAPCDLIRIAAGTSVPGDGIERALVFAGEAPPDVAPATWTQLPAPPFAVYEDAAPGELPLAYRELQVTALSPATVEVRIAGDRTEVPRYWLARMLFRLALHELRLNRVETYGGFYVDDSQPDTVALGLRTAGRRAAIAVPRGEALALVERLYRAVAPPGFRERLA